MVSSLVPSLFIVIQCCSAFAFVPSNNPGIASPKTLAKQRGKGNIIRDSHNDIIEECHTIDGKDEATLSKPITTTTTRRNALQLGASCSLSFLTTTTAAFATDDEDASTTTSTAAAVTPEPFNVLLTIQVNSQKPDELSEIEIECRPDWAPLATRRFRELVELGFYTNCPFFRVLPGFIAQFGVSSDKELNKRWMYCDDSGGGGGDDDATAITKEECKLPLADEPRIQTNEKGTLSFATSGKNTRRTQVFFNSANNGGLPNFLDGQGFVPFAKIVRGMDVVKELNGEYGGKVNQGKAAYYGGEYFEKVFPRLSIIREARVM